LALHLIEDVYAVYVWREDANLAARNRLRGVVSYFHQQRQSAFGVFMGLISLANPCANPIYPATWVRSKAIAASKQSTHSIIALMLLSRCPLAMAHHANRLAPSVKVMANSAGFHRRTEYSDARWRLGNGSDQSVLALARTNSDSSILAIISGGEFPTRVAFAPNDH
jgi:hypothetical protein